jgi:hypothetical protein
MKTPKIRSTPRTKDHSYRNNKVRKTKKAAVKDVKEQIKES